MTSCSTFTAGNGVLITGAGTSGANYIGTVSSCTGTTLTVTPTTATSVASGHVVQHDETAAFIAAIAAIQAQSDKQGTIYLSSYNGTGAAAVYLINGPLQDTGGANAVIPLPKVGNYSTQLTRIMITGFDVPPAAQISVYSGAVIQTSLPTGNLFGGYDSSSEWLPYPFTNVDFVLNDLSIYAYSNPCSVMVNGTYLLGLELTNVSLISSLTYPTPSCTTGAGVLYPSGGNNLTLAADNLNLAGWYRGAVFGEHTHIGRAYGANNVKGFVFDSQSTQGNSISADYLWCQLCTNMISAGSSPTEINVTVADSEVSTTTTIYDPSSLLHGIVNVTVPYSDGRSTSTVAAPTINGATNLKVYNLVTGACFGFCPVPVMIGTSPIVVAGSSISCPTCGVGTAGAILNITGSVTVSGCTIVGSQCVVGTAGTTVIFSSIPSGYRALKILFTGASSVSGGSGVHLQFNGDTGTNYSSQTVSGYQTSVTGGQFLSVASVDIFNMSGSGAPLHQPGTAEITVDLYSGTVFTKMAKSSFFANGALAENNVNNSIMGFNWNSTAAIASASFIADSGNFVVGSSFSVYGIQ